ncbi:MAG: hypothetical protein DME55_12855 [Verrucomicrobia bacterium]|nr:MAG: hypothetical protein DME55_12855 [Verrucomicrobiota bacterium]
MKMLKMMRRFFWVVLFLVLIHPTWAKDERSIRDLAKALTKLARARKRGWCGHWAQDIGTQLKELKLRTLVIHWGVAYDHTSSENNCLVVTARNQPFTDGIILDGWRRAGRLFWCPVIKDDEYEVEQHYGHSGITAWKENNQWSAWLQDYEPGKPKSKMATDNKASKASSERDERGGNSDSRQPVTP